MLEFALDKYECPEFKKNGKSRIHLDLNWSKLLNLEIDTRKMGKNRFISGFQTSKTFSQF